MKSLLSLCTAISLVGSLGAGSGIAQTFVGTNAPGQATNFSFTVSAGATNLTLVVSNSATAYSYLLLARGRAPTDADFDFVSRLDGVMNQIVLEPPEFATTNYGLRVQTPAASETDPFQVVFATNRTDVRSAAYPTLKPLAFTATGTLTNAAGQGGWHYFQVDAPTNLSGWRLVLATASGADADLYVRKGALPTPSSYTSSSRYQPLDTIVLDQSQATAGTYFVGVYLPACPATNVTYTLSAELGWLTALTWDPGTDDLGTEVFTNRSNSGGDYYFRLTTASSANSAWRTALRVSSGEADLYLRLGAPAQTTSYSYASSRFGSDGVVLAQGNQFSPGQDWYLTVHASPGAQWTLLSGAAYVQALPDLATDGSSSASATIGPEGIRFFRTTISPGTLAWRIWLNGQTNRILVHSTKAPLPVSSPGGGYYDWTGNGQMLLVPPYLGIGSQYHVGVIGDPGLSIHLDSRQQAVTDLAFNSITNFTVTGFGFMTFRVQVPVQQIAWQMNLTPTSGDANLAVSRDNVPNEYRNNAYSEVAGSTGDSLTLVPPTLSDGTFYITVYGQAPYTCTLTNGEPVITDVDYVFAITNDAPTRAGWRFYRVPDTAQQLGSFGWDLELSNQFPNTEIALRRNAVPGRWYYRECSANCSSIRTLGYLDYSGTQGFLQRPGHQADIWYIGIYQPAAPLGNFVLTGQELTGTPLAFDPGTGSAQTVVNQSPGKWQYFIIDVPADALGWDLRLTNVMSGDPRLVVCRDRPPYDLGTHTYSGSGWYYPWTSSQWPSGYSWGAGSDWTGYSYDEAGASTYGKLLQIGMGNPLSPGTYYVGVRAPDNSPTPLSYTFLSRGIGANYAIPVGTLAYAGGQAANQALPAREVAYYAIDVPSNAPSWKLRLAVTNEAMLAVQRSALPNVACGGSPSTGLNGGHALKSPGDEEYLLLPMSGQTNVLGGTYYVAVVSEGQNPTSSRYGTNVCQFGLSSLEAASTNQLGMLDVSGATELSRSDALQGGEIKFYSFTVPPGALAMEVRLDDRVGNPRMTLRADDQLPATVSSYGRDHGQPYGWHNDHVITIGTPAALTYTVAVQADMVSGAYPDATFTLRVRAMTASPVLFDGGVLHVLNQPNGTWRYFQITVPSDVLGWDLRITNAAGEPRFVLARDVAPDDLSTHTFSGGGWYYPWTYTQWPASNQWAAGYDWTGWSYDASGSNRYGQILQMGMGNPLEPGNYYVGVINGNQTFGGDPMSYSLVSRGIGTNNSIRVLDLPFLGSVSSNGLPPREVAYYRVPVPTNSASWKLRLEPISGEAMLMLQKDFLPNVAASYSSPVTVAGGRALQKKGNEHHVLYPRTTETFLSSGTYYVAVASEGMDPGRSRIGSNWCDFTLTSQGPAPISQLGAVDPSGATDLTMDDSLEGGEIKFYQFAVPPGTLNLEVRLENRTGNPYLTLRSGPQLVRGADSYGESDGLNAVWSDASLISLVSPDITNYTLAVQGRSVGGSYTNATYTVRLHASGLTPLAFDNGAASVTNQAAGTWRYFAVTVPPDALGWDLRLAEVTSGEPRLVVRRGDLPDSLNTHSAAGGGWYYPWTYADWPDDYQWAAGYDWTDWSYDNDGSSAYGHLLAMGTGNPLSPGSYTVGVINASGTTPMAYTLVSRSIGPGLAIPVGTMPFVGSITNTGLQAREVAYYRVEIPSGQPSWRLRLAASEGECMLMLQRSNVVNVAADSASPATRSGGRAAQKAGNEQYLLLPDSGQTTIPSGTYYVGIASEGQNPGSSRIGSNTCSAVLTSFGPLPVHSLGNVGDVDLTDTSALEAGQTGLYDFNVPLGTQAVEVRLDNLVGNVHMTLRAGSGAPTPYYSYGRNGGQGYTWHHAHIITLPNVTSGFYSLALQADPATSASYQLRVRALPPTDLGFDVTLATPTLTNMVFGSLVDQQKQYLRVTVPIQFKGQPVLGWKLDLDSTSGNPRLRVQKDSLPQDNLPGNTPYATSQGVIVPPYLTPGTWYVEVQGQGASDFAIRSSALLLERPAWAMPQKGGSVTTSGLPAAGPLFGDSGVDTNGVALPLDQGVDLEQGRMHYYAVQIPSNNVGIIRTRLDAISGDPNLYLRADHMPTLTHYVNGTSGGACYDRYLTANVGSEYGNWVPLNGRFELQLPPGTWYLAVQASGNSNVRYRLRCYTGIITPLPFDGVSLINQTLAAGDWRYYKVQLPTNAPTSWNVNFAQNLGDVVMYIRDTSPPGNGSYVSDYRDWADDTKNHGPYPSVDAPGTTNLFCPPLRPGHAYYLGFRAVSDATFGISSTTNSARIDYTNTVPFYSGYWSNNLLPHSVLKLRVDVPADGRRLQFVATSSNEVYCYLEQGSVPTPGANHAIWHGNYTLNYALYNGSWPWVPGYMYFLLVTNTSAGAQPFVLNSDGRNAATDDYDGDGLPDAWELTYFPSINSYNGNGDPDGDGVNNQEEYAESTIPTNSLSYHPRLLATGTPGVVTRDPAGTPTLTPPKVWYPLGQIVQLTATPDSGYSFIGWSGGASSIANPIQVVMDDHKTITANFGITNNSGAEYEFQMNLSSSVGSPPDLQNIGAGNFYLTVPVDGCPRTVLRFPQGNGLLLQPTTGVVPTNTYTIVVLFRFDTVSGSRRVLDFQAGTTDTGLYVQNGSLRFSPNAAGPAAVLASNWVQVVVTRDTSGTVAVYANGAPQLAFSDSSGLAVVSSANALRFFKDNASFTEESAGEVARLRLYAAAMTPAQVAILDRTDCAGVPHFLTPWFDSSLVLNLPVEHLTPGVPYRLLGSTNLMSWHGIVTNTPLADSAIFTDPAATNYDGRMYRLVTP